MKILFISALLPYPHHQGGQVRIYNLLKRVARRHDVTLLSFIRSNDEIDHIKNLDFCRKVIPVMRGSAWQMKYILSAALSTKPLLYATYANDEMKRAIINELATGDYDLIHLEPSYVWPSLPHTNIPSIVVEHNIESSVYAGFVGRFKLLFARPILFFDVLKLWFAERYIWKHASHIVAVSEEDASVIKKVNFNVSVVPNGVDLEIYSFRSKIKKKKLIFLFVGYFGWLQNRDALTFLLDNIWPKIIAQFPSAKLRVVGNNLPNALTKKLKGEYISEVSDLASEYHNADFLLAPIRIGGGTRYKILEAMACGTPVITTTKGAEGLGVVDRKELFIADSPAATIEAVGLVTQDVRLRKKIVTEARRLVEKNYSWDQLAGKLEGVWQYVAKKSR